MAAVILEIRDETHLKNQNRKREREKRDIKSRDLFRGFVGQETHSLLQAFKLKRRDRQEPKSDPEDNSMQVFERKRERERGES
jgi:hypothetical protein